MKNLRAEAYTAYVQRETGAVAGIARTMQAQTVSTTPAPLACPVAAPAVSALPAQIAPAELLYKRHPLVALAAPAVSAPRTARAPAGAVLADSSTGPVSKPWVIDGKLIGRCVPATDVFSTLPGLEHLAMLNDMTIRQLDCGQQDPESNDVSGYFALSDAAATVLFSDNSRACRWASNHNQVNVDIAPSLTHIADGKVKLAYNLYN